MTFSWEKARIDAMAIKLKRAKIMAKNDSNLDFNIRHPDECRDAKQGNYVKLEARIKKELQTSWDTFDGRIDKLVRE